MVPERAVYWSAGGNFCPAGGHGAAGAGPGGARNRPGYKARGPASPGAGDGPTKISSSGPGQHRQLRGDGVCDDRHPPGHGRRGPFLWPNGDGDSVARAGHVCPVPGDRLADSKAGAAANNYHRGAAEPGLHGAESGGYQLLALCDRALPPRPGLELHVRGLHHPAHPNLHPSGKGRIQAAHDFIMFGFVALATFLSGRIFHQFDWGVLNQVGLPPVLLTLGAVLWLRRRPIKKAPGG